jgi:lipoate---protein ligase
MLFIDNPYFDPYFNIAAEEYFLKYLNKEIVMLWRSSPSIIVGKHQNTLAEINLPWVLKNNIPVIRRLSGGGTVFHDPGNINFTFIREVDKEKMVDFKSHTLPVIEFLHSLGVDARFEGKNDLRVNGLKISGNAEHIHRNKVLHHGTLLFDSDLEQLNEAIKAKEFKFNGKAIKSVRSKVVNVGSLLKRKLTCDDFLFEFKKFFFDRYPQMEEYQLQDDDIRVIDRIKESKYLNWEWNYGYSPVYVFNNSEEINSERIEIQIKVKKGVCESVDISVNGRVLGRAHPVISSLKGVPHNPQSIDAVLSEHNFMNYNNLEEKWVLLGLFF